MEYLIFVIPVLMAWSLIASEITYRQRVRLTRRVFDQGNWYTYLEMYHQVSHWQHHWYVFTMRNAYKLYHEELRKLVKNG